MMLRDVIEEPNFSEDFDLLREAHPEFDMDAVHSEITWTLATDPRAGKSIAEFPDPTYRVFKTTQAGGRPVFSVLYRYTDTQVFLLGIDHL